MLDEENEIQGKEDKNIYIQKIKDLMKYIIEQNNKNKYYKISLYKIRGFEPYTIFNDIDNISSGLINHSDLSSYFSQYNIIPEKEIIRLFIREYNKQENDNNLNAQDFVKFLNFDIDKSSINLGELDFDKNQIIDNFLNLMKSEFNLIKEKNILINNIKKIKEFSTYEAFYMITNDKKYIDYDCLNNFLEEKFSKTEIKELIYRLDMNNDGKIDYNEFQDLFFPFQKHLQLEEETNDIDYYDDLNKNIYDIKINDNYYCDLNPYKDNTFTEPKIIDKDNNNNKSDIISSDNLFKSNEEINNDTLKESIINKNSKNKSINITKIKYDENLLNEINEKQNKDNNENKNKSNQFSNENNGNKKAEIDKFNIYSSTIMFEDDMNEPKKELDEMQNKLNVDENNNILISKNNSNQNMINSNDFNINNYDIKDNLDNSKDIPENLRENNNFTNIFTDKDKIAINLFIDYINSIILLESKAENLRESISLCDDIYLLNIFYLFDKDNNNYISKENFNDVCNKEYLIFPSEFQIKLLYDRFDLNNDNQLDLDEFINMIRPLNKEYFTLWNKDFIDINKSISFESKKKVIDLFKTIFDNESIIYELKTKLIANKNFNFIELWGLLMKYSKDELTLTKEEFICFLEHFGCYCTQFELDIIFNKFSKGKNSIEYQALYKDIII